MLRAGRTAASPLPRAILRDAPNLLRDEADQRARRGIGASGCRTSVARLSAYRTTLNRGAPAGDGETGEADRILVFQDGKDRGRRHP